MEDIILKFVEEIRDDYMQYGKDRDVEEWLKEALKRHIPGMTDDEAERVKNELIAGVDEYRQKKEQKIILKYYLKSKNISDDKLADEIENKISEFINDFFEIEEIDEIRQEKEGEAK